MIKLLIPKTTYRHFTWVLLPTNGIARQSSSASWWRTWSGLSSGLAYCTRIRSWNKSND